MKKQILISLIIISSGLTMNGQWNGTNPVWTNSDVGIGTISPVSKLDVRGDLYVDSGKDDNHIYWGSHNMTLGTRPGDYSHNIFSLKPGGATQGKLISVFSMYNANSPTSFESKIQLNTEGVSFLNGGNIGIGTETPKYKLDVEGTIRAKEIKVCLQGGCDFVFKKDYKLMSLNELEKFVTTKQHLPEIASEKEMIENGLNMKEFQMKLLQKMEEMTLYVIEQNKQLKLQSNKIEKQNQEFKILKAEIKKIKSTKR